MLLASDICLYEVASCGWSQRYLCNAELIMAVFAAFIAVLLLLNYLLKWFETAQLN